MKAISALDRLRSPLRRFARDRDGVSAVEFALVLPFMLTLYLGGVELGEGMEISFKVSETARTVTDLASQYVTISTSQMSTILGASSVVIQPYSAASMTVTLSQVKIAANATQGTINGWSCSLNGTAHTVGSSVTLPTNLQNPPATVYLILGEVSYPYQPSLGYAITGTINMYQATWFYPRLGNFITGPSSC